MLQLKFSPANNRRDIMWCQLCNDVSGHEALVMKLNFAALALLGLEAAS
jgi:hypothetical protein